MVSSGRDRRRLFRSAYGGGVEETGGANDAADSIIDAPDRYLLSQEGLFNAEGGWATFALTVGLGVCGAGALIAVSPKHGSYLFGGNMRWMHWRDFALVTGACGFLGQQAGLRICGDYEAQRNHWLAYTYVKSQNRYDGQYCLSAAPFMF